MKRLRSCFKYSALKFKNQKYIPVAVDVLLKAYPMVPLSCKIADPIWPDGTLMSAAAAASREAVEGRSTLFLSNIFSSVSLAKAGRNLNTCQQLLKIGFFHVLRNQVPRENKTVTLTTFFFTQYHIYKYMSYFFLNEM
jgi:hypothetical protein